MNNEVKEKVRPIYEELRGYLSGFPLRSEDYYPSNSFFWTSIGDCIERLNKETGNDYGRFKITPIPSRGGDGEHITNDEYRAKVNGLISNLKGTYFNDEDAAGNPLISVNQTTSVQVTMIVEVTEMIAKQLYGENAKNLKPEERTFLEKLKEQLPAIKTAAGLIAGVIKIAQECGLDMHTIAHALGL